MVVIDHIGRMPTSAGIGDPGFRPCWACCERRCWVKLSGANRMGDPTPPYASVVPFAHALVDAGADHLVWGTDWPHVREPGAIPDDGGLLNLLQLWVPDRRLRNAILSDNPAACTALRRAARSPSHDTHRNREDRRFRRRFRPGRRHASRPPCRRALLYDTIVVAILGADEPASRLMMELRPRPERAGHGHIWATRDRLPVG